MMVAKAKAKKKVAKRAKPMAKNPAAKTKAVSKKAPAKKAASKKPAAKKTPAVKKVEDNGKPRKFQVDLAANELNAFNMLKGLGGYDDSRACMIDLIRVCVKNNEDLSDKRKREILKELG